jgi:hypothetical protein
MFHPHYLRLFFGIPHTTTEAMGFVAAAKVEEDLQQAWREEGEKTDPYKPVDYNQKADGPYKAGVYKG